MRRNLVSKDQLNSKESTVTLIDVTMQRRPFAVISVDCLLFKGKKLFFFIKE